jgi:putative intracellular protease/amidase/ribosomal protein S18 acetylase RimI-like enzyme
MAESRGELTVRRAADADIPAIRQCLRAAFEPYRAAYTAAAYADTVPGEAGIGERLRSMTCLVACDVDQEVVGTLSAQILDPTEGHLRGMAVRPEWQGSTVASALIASAEKLLRDAGCTVISLDTTQPLNRAQRFYERHGFASTGRVQDFFGMTLFEYKKSISSPDQLEARRVLILLFDRVEVLDFAGPYEVFSLAENDAGAKLCSVRTVALAREITCMGGLKVGVDYLLAECPQADLLVVPGGPGARIADDSHAAVLSFLSTAPQKFSLIASVCTGSFLLARAGLLDKKTATTHPDRLEQFTAEFPGVRLRLDKIVDEGALLTAGGISSGIDLALYIIDKWFGRECRGAVAKRLDGAWK